MTENPDAIRADIEATRARLGTDVDAVADKVTPSHIVHRQTDKARNTLSRVKDRIMGTAESTTGHMEDRMHEARHTTGAAVHDAGAAISEAPQQVLTKTQGNPLAAGLIAFGTGMLLSSLIPASEKEREAARQLKTAAEPLATELGETAKDMAEGLKEPAREAMENVKATAAEATDHVKGEGQMAADDLRYKAADAKDHVQNP
jgi:ElaB/YqjD/DUF883 family membrane-anchored ribosome-binding protein